MSEELMRLTFGDLLDQVADRYPDHDGVIYNDHPFRKSYSEFRDICNRVAKGFLAMGIRKGDKVAIWATNYPQWLITMFASAKIGAIMVTVNTSYKIFELEYLLKQSDSKALVMIKGHKDSDYLGIVQELCPELAHCAPGELNNANLPELKHVILVGEERQPGMYLWDDVEKMGESISDEELAAIQASLDCDEVINMQYTSGTTGFPKGVMLTHYNVVNNGKCIGDRLHFTPEDRLCITVPFFHCFGMVLSIMACLTHASTMVPVEYYSPLRVMKTLSEEHCTAFHGVPTMFIGILEHPDFAKYDFSSLCKGIMAGSLCPIQLMRQVVEEMNMKGICSVYGLTEASPGCTQTDIDDPFELRVTTVGKVLPHIEAKIIDPETGEELPDGQPGEFMARGYNIMKGYYKMPEATARVIEPDGWLHSGDIAIRDPNGFFRITGRLKDMIIRGGENIYPKEIEDFIHTHPAVSNVEVVGVPSKDYGEEVLAFVILKEGESCTEDEIKQYVRANMARHKTPRYVLFVNAFPMTGSGKIQKFKLREMGAEMLGLLEED